MKYLMVILLILTGCTKTIYVDKMQEIVLPKSGHKCVLYPTSAEYPIPGGDAQPTSKKVFIVINVFSTMSQAIYQDDIKVYGYFVDVFNGRYSKEHNWMDAIFIDHLKVIECSKLGEVIYESGLR